jgi:hypothetical protein
MTKFTPAVPLEKRDGLALALKQKRGYRKIDNPFQKVASPKELPIYPCSYIRIK